MIISERQKALLVYAVSRLQEELSAEVEDYESYMEEDGEDGEALWGDDYRSALRDVADLTELLTMIQKVELSWW